MCILYMADPGRAALDRLQPLGFQLSGWNRSSKEVPGGRCYVGPDELEEFLGQCDIHVNMLPLTPLSALDKGHLGGAVLDVLVQEPPAQDNPLWKHPRVLLTPHIASDVQIEGGVAVSVENLQRECEGIFEWK
ncbi:hypothetical protein EMIT0P253_20321 [Pseudomonas sp. IT-P253]